MSSAQAVAPCPAAMPEVPDAAIAAANGEQDESFCQPHLERTGEQRPVHRMGMCRECWSGKPINTNVEAPRARNSLAARLRGAATLRRKMATTDLRARISAGGRNRWKSTSAEKRAAIGRKISEAQNDPLLRREKSDQKRLEMMSVPRGTNGRWLRAKRRAEAAQ